MVAMHSRWGCAARRRAGVGAGPRRRQSGAGGGNPIDECTGEPDQQIHHPSSPVDFLIESVVWHMACGTWAQT
eukprot:1015663-Prymnesium_polylepis.1